MRVDFVNDGRTPTGWFVRTSDGVTHNECTLWPEVFWPNALTVEGES